MRGTNTMISFNSEMIEKAKAAKSASELLALAKENNIELSEEEAKSYFLQLNPKSGELSDDELDAVAGGGCHSGDRLVVSALHLCTGWECKKCYNARFSRNMIIGDFLHEYNGNWMHKCEDIAGGDKYMANCTNCRLCSYENGLWLCNHSSNSK